VVAISEDTEPPVPLSQPRPSPPAEFVAAGEDAVVVVKFEVTEAGTVANARVVKGHPLLDAVVLAAVRGWRFKPAMSQGKPVAYPKTVKIPFRIRT
jgi:protein TonB